jgi:hypothetical protein
MESRKVIEMKSMNGHTTSILAYVIDYCRNLKEGQSALFQICKWKLVEVESDLIYKVYNLKLTPNTRGTFIKVTLNT